MNLFKHIVIIYNPNSTGDSPSIAKKFAAEARTYLDASDVQLKETEHAGHAETLAYDAAKSLPDVLIVSVSGDGGYHEVINGALRAQAKDGSKPVCAVLPGGNANDHYSSVSKRPLIEALRDGAVEHLDVLAVRINDTTTYAHSYAGLGLTPLVAVELNRHSLSALKESWLAIKTFWKFRPFTIALDGKKQRFDSLVLANIDRMAKYLTLSEEKQPNDGLFEVVRWPHHNKLRLIAALLRSAFHQGEPAPAVRDISFSALRSMPMQLDGEITQLAVGDTVRVTCAQGLLRTLR
ncbi:MAG: diacylglycerol kinase family protein [Candidatus Saccharimonadales bacterium]